MKNYLLFLIICTSILLAQDFDNSSLKNKILIGGDVGFTVTASDYKDLGVGFLIRGVGEYYFFENGIHKIGVRGYGGYGIGSGKDNRYNPDGFNTHLYTIAVGGIYSFQLIGVVSPYFFAGVQYLRFNPKDNDGNTLPNNAAKVYDRNKFNFTFEFGLRYQFSNQLFGYSSFTPISFTDDYIDDRKSGNTKDFIASFNFGLLYKFTAPWVDSDLDVVEHNTLPEGIEKIDKKVITKPAEINNKDEIVTKEKKEIEIASEAETETGLNNVKKEADKEAGAKKSNIVEELSHKLESSKVNFDFGKTELDRLQYVELDRLLNIIEKDSKSKWEIIGYTDNLEPVQIHQSIAIQRAYFVLRYFMSRGIDRDRFEIVVKGTENPIGDNSTEQGRAKNRRVEILRMN